MLTPWSIDAGHLVANALAERLRIPTPPRAWIAFAAQAQREDAGGTSVGARRNNPLNLTTAGGRITWPGQTGTYGGGSSEEWHGDFAAFGSLAAGALASAQNYASGLYADVVEAFRGGDPVAIARAIEASPWDSGHYGYTLAAAVAAEIGEANMAITREQYAAEIEPLVKETIGVMLREDGATRETVAQIAGRGAAPSLDTLTSTVASALAARLTRP